MTGNAEYRSFTASERRSEGLGVAAGIWHDLIDKSAAARNLPWAREFEFWSLFAGMIREETAGQRELSRNLVFSAYLPQLFYKVKTYLSKSK